MFFFSYDLSTVHILYWQFTWPFISRHISCSFSPWVSSLNKQTMQPKAGVRLCCCVQMPGLCCVPLNGDHRSVKMRLLKPADRWPTRPWIACNISASIPTGVFDCCGAPQESHLLTSHCDQWYFFPSDKIEKKWNWHSRLGNESIAASQAVWLSKTHKCRAG